MKRVMFTAAIAAASLATSVASAGSINIFSDNANSTENLGSYEGSLAYNSGVFTVTLKNTSVGVTAAKLTGFVFNIDGNASASFIDSDNATTAGFDESAYGNLIGPSASPFGTFDFGAALGGDFLGGGSPNAGIDIGETGIFQFNVSGADAGSLTVMDFFGTDSGATSYAFAARFKGIQPGDKSDKVPALIGGNPPPPHVVPLPPAAWSGLATMALSGFYFGRQKLKALKA